MTFLLLAGAVLAVLVLVGRTRKAQWRPVGAIAALAALTVGATLLALKVFIPAIALIGFAALLAVGARARPGPGAPPRPGPPPGGEMSVADARALLGVEPDATRAEIQAAYRRLMQRIHPDQGGTEGLAAQLDAARDRLLR